MATVQHSAIADPNIHEPKGVAYAAAGTAYVANGAGSGSWLEVLTPSSLVTAPSITLTGTLNIGSTVLANGVIFPIPFATTPYTFGSYRIEQNATGFLSTNKAGIYLVSAKYSVLASTSASVENRIVAAPTRYVGSLVDFQPYFFPTVVSNSNTGVTETEVANCIVRLDASNGFGFWVTGKYGTINRVSYAKIDCTIQLTRLSDA